ncbi:uncharacterized protein LOC127290824 [Leptopilina boulardi]|uniref:uncharacterized protein LOC127290824 n=1 Tax=Leptopilina boulardi TaxID=63433 RepID=UPI0021F555BF|nr:uncharacterized protein LOC127290824 [Leptopilina boulardi]
MTPEDFELLHAVVGPRLRKFSRRQPLPTRLRLALTLNFLANGDSTRTSQNFFRVGRSTVYNIIKEVCTVIFSELSPWYFRERTAPEWRIIAGGFRGKWNLPNCVGALDGKEISIIAPPHSGSLFFNYKKFFSIKLLASCDAFYRFTWADVGDYGSQSDLSTWRNTNFYQALRNNLIDLPPRCSLPRSAIQVPHFFVGDEIFTQRDEYLMTPIPRRYILTDEQRHYNYRISRARQTIEVAFGLLTSMWQILNQPLRFSLQTCMIIVMATICLHNFVLTRRLRRQEEMTFPEPGVADSESDEENNYNDDHDDDDNEQEIPRNVHDQINLLVAYLSSNAGRMQQ